jgi:hypothetical protein
MSKDLVENTPNDKPIGATSSVFQGSIKIDKQREMLLKQSVDNITVHIEPIILIWKKISEENKKILLDNSPILKRIITEIVEVLK